MRSKQPTQRHSDTVTPLLARGKNVRHRHCAVGGSRSLLTIASRLVFFFVLEAGEPGEDRAGSQSPRIFGVRRYRPQNVVGNILDSLFQLLVYYSQSEAKLSAPIGRHPWSPSLACRLDLRTIALYAGFERASSRDALHIHWISIVYRPCCMMHATMRHPTPPSRQHSLAVNQGCQEEARRSSTYVTPPMRCSIENHSRASVSSHSPSIGRACVASRRLRSEDSPEVLV